MPGIRPFGDIPACVPDANGLASPGVAILLHHASLPLCGKPGELGLPGFAGNHPAAETSTRTCTRMSHIASPVSIAIVSMIASLPVALRRSTGISGYRGEFQTRTSLFLPSSQVVIAHRRGPSSLAGEWPWKSPRRGSIAMRRPHGGECGHLLGENAWVHEPGRARV